MHWVFPLASLYLYAAVMLWIAFAITMRHVDSSGVRSMQAWPSWIIPVGCAVWPVSLAVAVLAMYLGSHIKNKDTNP